MIADKSLIVWRLTRDESSYGVPQKSLHGHGHFVSDVILSSDGQFALSGSWDHTLRLWDLSRYYSIAKSGFFAPLPFRRLADLHPHLGWR